MRAVSIDEFVTLPAGTVYISGCTVAVKGDTLERHPQIALPDWLETTFLEDHLTDQKSDEMEQDPNLRVPVSLTESRYGVGQSGDKFIILDDSDTMGLVSFLLSAIAKSNECSVTANIRMVFPGDHVVHQNINAQNKSAENG